MYSVVQFYEDGLKMFECIPDQWFVDDDRKLCYWPSKSGKTFTCRAINKEKPTPSWTIYPCNLVSGGHVTYKKGFEMVKEKCSQSYNTTSAEEHLETKKHRRKHPVLTSKVESFEHLFVKVKDENMNQTFEHNSSSSVASGVSSSPSLRRLSNESIPTSKNSTSRESHRSNTPDDKSQSSQRVAQRHSSDSIRADSSSDHESHCSSANYNQSHSSRRQTQPSLISNDFRSNNLKMLQQRLDDNSHRLGKIEIRLTRMEVTINKMFIIIGDMKEAINSYNSSTVSVTAAAAEAKQIPNGFTKPELPLQTIEQLISIKRNLENNEFRAYLIEEEKVYCSPSRQSDAVIMTAYLKRFLSLDLRKKINLKDAKKTSDHTLYGDFHSVYTFLIDVMTEGYKAFNTQLKSSDAHLALRTVWSRTNQLIKEQQSKKK